MSVWNVYEPSDDAPWDVRRVVHLHRRVVFGTSWPDVQRDVAAGPAAAVERVLGGSCRGEGVPGDFEHLAGIIGNAAVDSGSADRLKAWWIYRCLFSPDPLRERLALMWHNHFATSNLKVSDLRLMKQQNETLRRQALAPFGDLLRDMARDPALLEWLDAPSNRKGQPNENLARELMELFTLGVGHFTEEDVKAAARSLTGRTVKQGAFKDQPAVHDEEDKTLLGQTGAWTGDDVVRILLDQPATARRLAWRLTSEFFGEGVVSDAALEELAAGLREHNLDIRWGVETILRSELFFSDANIGTRVCDPVTFLVAPLRGLECWRNPPSTLVLAEWLTRMGLDLFYPPNVGGWAGGRTWLSTRTIIARTNYGTALTEGRLSSPVRPLDVTEVVARLGSAEDKGARVEGLCRLLLGRLDEGVVSSVCAALSNGDGPMECGRELVAALLARPEVHLH